MDTFEKEFEVRDYELDIQGIVNNAVYNNYFEHTRHAFLKSCGLNFSQMHDEGLDAVVIKMETEYKAPLQSGHHFVCTLKAEPEGRLKIVFFQEILKLPERKLMTKSRVTVACVKNNRPVEPVEIREKMGLSL
ncbi:MAG: acyl-CoA thioesterase [Bacteroidetes bacterium]|nr:acyl-CoA thioesterase [Bacteroidota bacterium]